MTGWIKLHRAVQDNSFIWDDKPFNRGSAWIDLLLQANHKRAEIALGASPIIVERGQFITSTVQLSVKWGWSRGKVRRFLDALKSIQAIDIQTDTTKTTITICNYDKYQSCEIHNGQQIVQPVEQGTDSERTQTRMIKNDKKKAKPYRVFLESDFSWGSLWGVKGKEALKEWIEYKAEAGHPSILKSYQKQIEDIEPRLFYSLVKRAIKNGWQGLNESVPFEQKQPSFQRTVKDPTPYIAPREIEPLGPKPERSEKEKLLVRNIIESKFPHLKKLDEG